MGDNGLGRVIAKLRTHAQVAISAVEAQAIKEAGIIAGLAQRFAPEHERDLIRSIRVEKATSITTKSGDVPFIGAVVKAGDETTIVKNASGGRFQNAKLQESGTQKMPANPYFNPAKRMRRRAARANITRALRKAWKDGGNGGAE